MNDLVARLFLDSKDFNGNLGKASTELRKFKGNCETVGKGVSSFANGLGISVGNLTKFGSVVGAAALAAEGFKNIIEKNDAVGDKYRYTMQNVNDQMDSFWKSVGSGNFSYFISNWSTVNALSQQYSRALDDAGTYIPILNAQLQVSQTRYNGLVAIAQDVLRSERERKGALAQATAELQKQYAVKRAILELEGKQAKAAFQLEFSERGGKGRLGDWSGRQLLQVDKNGKFNYQNRMEKLKANADMYDVFLQQNQHGMNGTTSYNGKNYTRQQRDAFINSQKHNREVYGNLKALDDVVQNNSQVVADYVRVLESGAELETFMNEQQRNLDRTLKRIGAGAGAGATGGGGRTGGYTGGGRVNTGGGGGNSGGATLPSYEEGSIASYDAKISEINKKLKEQNLTQEQLNSLVEQLNNLEMERLDIIRWQEKAKNPEKEVSLPEVELSGLDNSVMSLDQIKEALAVIKERSEENKRSFADLSQSLKDSSLDSMRSALEGISTVMGALGEEGEKLGSIFGQLVNDIFGVVSALGAMASAKAAETVATAASEGAKLPFPANIAGIAAGVAAGMSVVALVANLIAGISKFATGGIVGGTDYTGDKRTVRVNSGEMILNGRQQANLFNMINNGSITRGGGTVEFKLRGQELVGLINNYDSKRGRTL